MVFMDIIYIYIYLFWLSDIYVSDINKCMKRVAEKAGIAQ